MVFVHFQYLNIETYETYFLNDMCEFECLIHKKHIFMQNYIMIISQI